MDREEYKAVIVFKSGVQKEIYMYGNSPYEIARDILKGQYKKDNSLPVAFIYRPSCVESVYVARVGDE